MTLNELKNHVDELVKKYDGDIKLKAYQGHTNQLDDAYIEFDNLIYVDTKNRLSSSGEPALMCFYISV